MGRLSVQSVIKILHFITKFSQNKIFWYDKFSEGQTAQVKAFDNTGKECDVIV